MYPPFPMDRAGTTAGRFLRSLPVNALINTVIAVMLTGIGFSGGFVAILINAQCIGFSIYLLLLSVRHPPLQKGEGADRPDRRHRVCRDRRPDHRGHARRVRKRYEPAALYPEIFHVFQPGRPRGPFLRIEHQLRVHFPCKMRKLLLFFRFFTRLPAIPEHHGASRAPMEGAARKCRTGALLS